MQQRFRKLGLFIGASALVGAGFIVLYTVERLTHFHACRHRKCQVEHDDHVHGHVHTHASTTLMGIGLHNFIDRPGKNGRP